VIRGSLLLVAGCLPLATPGELMRIIHLLKHGLRDNGHVHVAVDLACAQADAGHDVVFASAGTSFGNVLRRHRVQVVDLPLASNVRDVLPTVRALWALCRQFRPDLIHAHMMSSALLAYPICKVRRIPLVTTMHNSFDKHSFLMRLGTVVVAVSGAERDLLLSRGYPARKVVTIVNGPVDSPREEPIADPPALRTPSVMTLSGLHPRKAVDDVVTAFADVAAQHPAWHLNVVGSGPQREELEAQAHHLGLDERIHFLGPSTNPRQLLEQTDIFATATLADPCPLTIMEARAAGCAIVGTEVGGIPETLDNGAAGLLVPTRDPRAMADAFERLMDSPELRSTLKQRALDGAPYYRVQRMAEDHLRLYGSLVRTQGTGTEAAPGRVE
jgi:glycosyltransferase involved in cell wall biosynthesis